MRTTYSQFSERNKLDTETPGQLPKPLPEDQIISHANYQYSYGLFSKVLHNPLNSKWAMLLAHLTKHPSQGYSCFFVAILAGSLLMFIVLRQLGAFLYVPMSTPHSVLLV